MSIVRTGGDEQGVFVGLSMRKGSARFMAKETETTFEAASYLRIRRLPGPIFGKRPQPIQAEAIRNRRELEVRQRRGRFPDCEAWMRPALQERHGISEPARDERQQRAAEARAENRQIAVEVRHDLLSTRCERFIRRNRVRLSRLQVGSCSRFHRSSSTRPARNPKPYSKARSEVSSDGGANSPCRANSSIAPLPARVGIKLQHATPKENA